VIAKRTNSPNRTTPSASRPRQPRTGYRRAAAARSDGEEEREGWCGVSENCAETRPSHRHDIWPTKHRAITIKRVSTIRPADNSSLDRPMGGQGASAGLLWSRYRFSSRSNWSARSKNSVAVSPDLYWATPTPAPTLTRMPSGPRFKMNSPNARA
jgi:hypothetical protein